MKTKHKITLLSLALFLGAVLVTGAEPATAVSTLGNNSTGGCPWPGHWGFICW